MIILKLATDAMVMEEETKTVILTEQHRGSVSAFFIFILVVMFKYGTRRLQQLKKMASMSPTELQLRKEIKQLLKNASSFSQPSTFAQAAKLKRLAAAKEKELAKCQESNKKDIKQSFGLYLKAIKFSKFAIYFILVCWFWGSPVAAISQKLLRPWGGLLSFTGGGSSNDYVMVGIIPWLAISNRVSKLVCRLFK